MAALRQVLFAFALFVVLCCMTDAKKNRECEVECVRTENTRTVGYDLNLNFIKVDVGDCHTVLTNSTSTGDCNLETIELEGTCLKRCIPKARKMLIISDRAGPKEVSVIKNCYPTMHHCLSGCERRPNIIYFFPDSKYQTRVDVGKCVGGGCNGTDSRCLSTKNTTMAIEGPNGAITVDVIDSCECAYSGCHRVDHFLSFWSYSNNGTQREEKEVNVGECSGGCPGVFLPGQCLPSDDNCILYIPGGPATCAPVKTGSVSYTNEHNEVQDVATIVDCGCTSG